MSQPGAGEPSVGRSDRLWSDQPVVFPEAVAGNLGKEAAYWSAHVFPIGNGRLGGTVFGHPAHERIQFNEDSLWVGNEHNTGAYQPFGDVQVELPHPHYSEYRRELDISRAVQTVRYVSGGVRYQREYFSSYPAQVMVCRFTADRPGTLTGKVYLGNLHEIPTTAAGNTLTMKGDTSRFWYWQFQCEDPQRLRAFREFASDKNIDLDLEAQVRVLPEGGAVKAVDNAIVFDQCDALTILLAADTNYLNQRAQGWRCAGLHERVSGWIAAAAPRAYADLLREHVADYQGLYQRLAIDLGPAPQGAEELPTAARREAYKTKRDPGLEALMYQYARYLMISSSRPGAGALPANLQGIWVYQLRPPWRCDFHTDVNIQMNYWFVDAANLAECFLPLPEWIESIREVRREETQQVLGVKRGWLMRSENGIFGGSTWHIQKGDSAWLCQNLWDHYTFTRDQEYLARYAYPVLKEISEFWVDHLQARPDGTLVAPDGRSPEHGPEHADGVSYDQQLCWDLFSNTIEASEALQVDAGFRQELIAKRDKLLGPQVGRWGQLQEWMEDIDDPENFHRHTSHLIAVYPGRQITPRRTPAFAAAAKVSLIARGDGETPGWAHAWRTCILARLREAERAYSMLGGILAEHTAGNLWAVHPPFQIDANFGFAAGVNEMLLQSHETVAGRRLIHLLPALPPAWRTGAVQGLKARGGVELDFHWREGVVQLVTLRATRDGQFVLRMNDQEREQSLIAGVRTEIVP